jgi:putative ABC transport system permease protein
VLDRLALTATESVWQVHDKSYEGDTPLDAEDKAAIEADREITEALIRYKSPLAAVTFPRYVNSSTNMQAAAPAVEITRLLRMVGVGTDVLRGFGVVLLLTAGLSVFIALWNAVRERQADLAMLRMLGASPVRVASLLLCEALWLALLASAFGLIGGHLLTSAIGAMLAGQQSLPVSGWTWVDAEWAVPGVAAVVALLAAMLPTWAAYRLDVFTLLNNQ